MREAVLLGSLLLGLASLRRRGLGRGLLNDRSLGCGLLGDGSGLGCLDNGRLSRGRLDSKRLGSGGNLGSGGSLGLSGRRDDLQRHVLGGAHRLQMHLDLEVVLSEVDDLGGPCPCPQQA